MRLNLVPVKILTDQHLIAERIYSRILEKPHWYKFFSLPISVEWITSLYEPLIKNVNNQTPS